MKILCTVPNSDGRNIQRSEKLKNSRDYKHVVNRANYRAART